MSDLLDALSELEQGTKDDIIAELVVENARLKSDMESMMDRACDRFGLIIIEYNERMAEQDKRIAELGDIAEMAMELASAIDFRDNMSDIANAIYNACEKAGIG